MLVEVIVLKNTPIVPVVRKRCAKLKNEIRDRALDLDDVCVCVLVRA